MNWGGGRGDKYLLTLGSSLLVTTGETILPVRGTRAVLDKGVGDRGHFIRRSKWEAMCNDEMGETQDRGVYDRAAAGVAMAAS